MAINNPYTTQAITTNSIPTSGGGILDNPSIFPPENGYRMLIKPKPGNQIQAAQFKSVKRIGINSVLFDLSLQDDTNSQTKWPSRFELTTPGLGEVDSTTLSGFKDFEGFYKVVFEDSTNPTNDVNWDIISVGNSNQVYMWVYFGKNETTAMDSLSSITIDLDIDAHPDVFTLSDTTGVAPTPVITNFNI